MRILCVGSMYPPHHLGGYELVWKAAVDHLRRSGHLVRVLCSDHGQAGGERRQPEEETYRELRWYWQDHGFPRVGPRGALELERANAAILDGHLDGFAPDVVAWWAMGGMSLSLLERARRRGLPSVAFVNDDWLIYGPRVDAWLRLGARVSPRLLERATGLPARFEPGAVDRVVFASEATRASALARWPLARTEVAPGGIDRLFLEAAPVLEDWGWQLLYVGRIDPRKGIATVLQALAGLPAQAMLRVVGGGEEAHLDQLRALADRLGVTGRVLFAGQRERRELPSIYAAADVVIFPVLWAEPWGLVPLEAMACGRPVVATGTGGSAEYLRDGENCLLFAPGDAEQLVERLGRLAVDGGLRERLRAGGLETARLNTDESFNARVEAVIGELVAG